MRFPPMANIIPISKRYMKNENRRFLKFTHLAHFSEK